ncbi:hypothetical protein P154DRAFT_526545 [Amniculicola lignicola CBS 123094]|uniref:F-box domain-containing protein n=1 Tax=Amniculicola lignicola CBS 123094 TaxID=1392246 RepID=A0A6A5VZP7_9PLEO|nr:hypothetical protein P154DRAFT_526545 [Amniculicola lignicola CBS 123094]
MESTCSRVLNTPELLEAILLQLPERDILLAQQVSRTFQAAITSSPALQQALFFREVPFKDPKIWKVNPLLREHFLPWFVISRNKWQLPDHSILERMDWARDHQRRRAFLRPTASWRKMLVTQPPAKKLEVYQHCHGQMDDVLEKASVHLKDLNTPGIPMSILYDISQRFIFQTPASGFEMTIKNTTSGSPKIILYLVYTVQCCITEDFMDLDLRSLEPGAWDMENLEFESCAEELLAMFGIWMKNDLTAEKGGVPLWEFERWNRERAPLSSLLSDVR